MSPGTPTRRSPRNLSPRRSTRSPRKWKKITELFPKVSQAQLRRNQRAKAKARRDKAIAEEKALSKPPTPRPSQRKARTKAERRSVKKRRPNRSLPIAQKPIAAAPPSKNKSHPSTSKATKAIRQRNATPSTKKRQYNPPDPEVLKEAVAFYDKQRASGSPWKKTSVANKFGLPSRTFANYAHDNPSKRFKIGAKCGRPSVVPPEVADFIIQTTVRADRANNGLRPKDAIENIIQLTENNKKPLTYKQASNFVYSTMKKDPRVCSKLVVAQKTSSKRSMTSVAHQWRWHHNFQMALNQLRMLNTGLCQKSGKTFGELIDHFVIGADEACLLADAHGSVKILGAADKKKHERKVSDCRASITMFRSGVTVGSNGPTGFLMKGKKKRAGYTDGLLLRHGCEPGSTLIMTENAFMTNEAWIELTKKVRHFRYYCS